MIIKTLKISNFKGISNKEITMKDKTVIRGQNGTGKTTIADAWYWLMSGKDSTLTDNPNIIPIGVTEANPTVEAVLDIDGKEVTVRKVQKYKNKDGKESTTNQYLVNEVPLTERDYKAKMETYGVDLDKLLVLSHPDYLLRDTSKKGRDFVRNEILFPMAQKATDKQIASKAKLKELTAELDNYDLTEIEKMQKAVLARITKEIGKDNAVANARIDELTRSKSNLKADGIQKQITETQAKLNKNLDEQKTLTDKVIDLQQEILKLSFDKNAIVSAQNDDRRHKMFDLDNSIVEAELNAKKANKSVDEIKTMIEVKQQTVKTCEERISVLKKTIKEQEKTVFDKKETICPTCGQEYPADQIKEIEKRFTERKYAMISASENEIAELEITCDNTKSEIATLYANMDGAIKIAKGFDKEAKTLKAQLTKIKNETEPKMPKEAVAIDKKIDSLNAKIEELDESNLKSVEENLRGLLSALNGEMAKANADKTADKRIAEIRKEIKDAEVARANAEKLLYQIECLNKAKNESLEDSINKHFKLVKWKLFKTLKNGSVEDACTPEIDGFELGKSANRGRETLAKLDIIAGLQKFYKASYPVFVDNFESVSNETADRITNDCQLVLFRVTEHKRLMED